MADNVQDNPKLATTIKVADQEYDIHAAQANKVKESLIINKIDTDGNTSNSIEFDGETGQSLNIVPAEGGKFIGPVSVESSVQENDGKTVYPSDAVLNYTDVHDVLLTQICNNSVLYTWDGTNLRIAGSTINETWPTGSSYSDSTLKSICIITGSSTEVNGFASKNCNCKKFAAFIYVANDSKNTGFIYFGTGESENPVLVQVSASHADFAKDAAEAEKLKNGRKINVNLGTTNSDLFDGTQNIEIGLKSNTILPEINGGTGTNNLTNITVGKATQLETARKITVDLASTSGAFFNGTATVKPGVTGTLPVANGGTGQTNLSNVSVGSANSAKKIATYASGASNASPSNDARIIVTSGSTSNPSGNDGDIWIKLT